MPFALGRWMRMPAITSAMPKSSCGPGICARTSAPITVAVAGSSASMSAKVLRGSRAIASWSQT